LKTFFVITKESILKALMRKDNFFLILHSVSNHIT